MPKPEWYAMSVDEKLDELCLSIEKMNSNILSAFRDLNNEVITRQFAQTNKKIQEISCDIHELSKQSGQ